MNYQEDVIKGMADGTPEHEQAESPEMESAEHGEVKMGMEDFLMEHHNLIELLREAGEKYGDQELIAEANAQEEECKKYEGVQQEQPDEDEMNPQMPPQGATQPPVM